MNDAELLSVLRPALYVAVDLGENPTPDGDKLAQWVAWINGAAPLLRSAEWERALQAAARRHSAPVTVAGRGGHSFLSAVGARVESITAGIRSAAGIWPLDSAAALRAEDIDPAKLASVAARESITFEEFELLLVGVEKDLGVESADSSADNGKKIPENLEVVKLAKFIGQHWAAGESEKSLALQFTEGDSRKSESLLRQLRRYQHLKSWAVRADK